MRVFRNITVALAGASLFAITQPAFAQQEAQAAEEGDDSDVIIVTARKREENLVDVPLPITVATEAQLKRDQVYSINDLQRITPALEIGATSGGESNGGGRLRGLGTGVFNPSVASSVAMVVDQVPQGNMVFPQLFDLAQVEVLRGPQGTLFGQGASAGVINIRTKAPSTEGYSGSASIDWADKGTAGSEFGELIVNAAVNAALSDDVAMRVATQYKRETGLQRSVTTGRDNVIEDFGIRMKVLLKPSERLTINLAGEHGQNTQDGQTFFAIAIAPNSTNLFDPPGPPPPVSPIGPISTAAFLDRTGCAQTVISARAEEYCEAIPTYTTLKATAFSGVVDWEADDSTTITSVSAYRKRTYRQFSRDFSRLSTAASARAERIEEAANGFSQELRASYDGDRLDLVVGGYYNTFTFDRNPIGDEPIVFGQLTQGNRIGFSVCPASGIGFCPVGLSFTDEATKNRTLATFADATFKVSDKFDIFGGLRSTKYRNSTAVRIFRVAPDPIRPPLVVKETNISGRIGGSYRPNSDTNIYASYSRGYKPTAVGTRAAGGGLFQLPSEISNAFELGAKLNVGRLQLAANIFYTSIANFQSQNSVFVGTQLVSEPFSVPGSVKSKGFELTAFGKVANGLSINAGYQFNSIKYPNGVFGDDAIDTNNDRILDSNVIPGLPFTLGGTQFLNAPKHKFTLSGEYETALSDNLELFVNANLVYKTKVLLAARANPAYRYPAHELINLGFGVRHPDDNWSASIFVRNLTKEREPTAYLASTFGGAIDGGIRAWPIAGVTARAVGVRVGFNF